MSDAIVLGLSERQVASTLAHQGNPIWMSPVIEAQIEISGEITWRPFWILVEQSLKKFHQIFTNLFFRSRNWKHVIAD